MMTVPVTYRVLFDVTRDARPDDIGTGWFTIGLLIAAGLLLFVVRRRLPPVLRFWFPPVVIAFGVLGLIGMLFRNVPQPSELAAAYRAGRCQVVEGVVTQFHAMPYTGHDVDSFVVAGRRFRYSDYIYRAGFNQTSSHGGPIHEGALVRITYLGEDIAKLEIADDKSI